MEVVTDDRHRIADLLSNAMDHSLEQLASDAKRNAVQEAPVGNRHSPTKMGVPRYKDSFGTKANKSREVAQLKYSTNKSAKPVVVAPRSVYNRAPHAAVLEWGAGLSGPTGSNYVISPRRRSQDLWIPVNSMSFRPPDSKIKHSGGTDYYVVDKVFHPGQEPKYIINKAIRRSMDDNEDAWVGSFRKLAEQMGFRIEESEAQGMTTSLS